MKKATSRARLKESEVDSNEFDRRRFKSQDAWKALLEQDCKKYGLEMVGDVLITKNPKADMRKTKLVGVDFCAGAGGASLGVDKVKGMHVAVAADFDKWCQLTYMINLGKDKSQPTAYIRRDVRQVKGPEILELLEKMGYPPFVDFMWLSPPCKAFSSLNSQNRDKRNWLDAPGNEPMVEAIRLVKELRPRIWAFENVPGLVRGGMRRVWDEWLLRMKEAGYSVTWKLVNAADYGVPQSRIRVIAIGMDTHTRIEYDPWNLEALKLDKMAERSKLAFLSEALKVLPAYWQENMAQGLDKFTPYEEAVLGHEPIPLKWEPEECDTSSAAELLRDLTPSEEPRQVHLRCPVCGWEDYWNTGIQAFPYDYRLSCNACLHEDDSLNFIAVPTPVDKYLGSR